MSERRIIFKSGDFIRLTNQVIARFDLAFIHELFPGDRRLFAVVTDVREDAGPVEDTVLGVPLLYLQSSQRIIGLPAISAANLYVISQTRKTYKLESSSFSFDQTQGEGIRTGTKEEGLLLCPWEISFL